MPLSARSLRAAGAALGALAVVSGVALAHDTWLLPARGAVPPGQEVTFDLTSGMRFPANEVAIPAERVAAARLRLGGVEDSLPTPRAATRALRFRVPLRRPGVATLWVDLAPRELALAPSEVREYLDEIGAPDSVHRAYEAQPVGPDGVRTFRERYAKHVKTAVRVTSPQRPVPGSDTSWRVPTGQGLEFVAEDDPTTLQTGGALRVRLLARGVPVPLATVGVVGPAAAPGARAPRPLVVRTDAVGRATIPLARPGRWLLRATLLRRATAPTLDWESDFATLTVVAR